MEIKIPEMIAVDVETTGLNPEIDRICEIALLRIKEENIVEKFISLINPEIENPPEIFPISGIRYNDLKTAPFFRDVVEKIDNFIKEKILLCHNANFDIPFIKKEFERAGYQLPKVKIIDTYLIAKKFFNFESNSLHNLSEYFNIKRISEHRAEDDAKATFEIFKLFCEEIKRKYNYEIDFIQKVIFDISQINNRIIYDETIVEKILKVIKEKKETVIVYVSDNKKEITKRKILPIEVFDESGVKYLKAFCYYRNEERIFRFDRIIEILENIKNN
ncbi:MAG: exonuclease domain-containing protein [Candidatus Omnitrophica bacterium]|nr:exonuclease domain-containing protein [Candidatus Omnitrophota bacterium]